MDKTIIASFAVLLLVIAAGGNMLYHSAEARSMSLHDLKTDVIMKPQFLLVQKVFQDDKKHPILPRVINW